MDQDDLLEVPDRGGEVRKDLHPPHKYTMLHLRDTTVTKSQLGAPKPKIIQIASKLEGRGISHANSIFEGIRNTG